MSYPKTMRAQVFHEPEKMQLEEVSVPPVAEDEVLIKVAQCGICGSDMAYYYGSASLETASGKGPLILGHEFTGEIAALGSAVAKTGAFKEGDPVVANPVQSNPMSNASQAGQPNLCDLKTVLGVSVDGGFAEYCVSKAGGTLKLPAGVSLEAGALAEPLACATYGVQNLKVEVGQTVAIFGAGPIGLMHTQLAKASGAGQLILIEALDYRLEKGLALGADVAINTVDKKSKYYVADLKAKIAELTNGQMCERALTATGNVGAMEAALEITGRKAIIVYFGLPADDALVKVPAAQSIFNDKTIRFSWLAPFTWPAALKAIATKRIDVESLISKRAGLSGLAAGIQSMRDHSENVLKILISPRES